MGRQIRPSGIDSSSVMVDYRFISAMQMIPVLFSQLGDTAQSLLSMGEEALTWSLQVA